MSTRYTEKPYASAKYLLKRLIGYVQADLIENKLSTVLTLVDDEVVQGAYINNENDYILLTTRSIFWQSEVSGGRHYPYTDIDALSLEENDENLRLQIALNDQSTVSIPLMNDRRPASTTGYSSVYEDIPDDLEELIKLHIEPLGQFEKICAWVRAGNPKESTLKALGISKYDTSRCFALYTALMELSDILESRKQNVEEAGEHQPGIYYLRGLSSFASRQDFIDQGRSPEECPPNLLGIYVNDESNYLIVESEKIVDCRMGTMVEIHYDELLSAREDNSGCINLLHRDNSSYLISVENRTEGLADLEFFLEFLEFKIHKPKLHEINDLFDLQQFLRHCSDRFPEYAKLATALPEFAPSTSNTESNPFTGFYRLLALMLTEPYAATRVLED